MIEFSLLMTELRLLTVRKIYEINLLKIAKENSKIKRNILNELKQNYPNWSYSVSYKWVTQNNKILRYDIWNSLKKNMFFEWDRQCINMFYDSLWMNWRPSPATLVSFYKETFNHTKYICDLECICYLDHAL